MKNVKRLLSLLLCFIMAVGMMPMGAVNASADFDPYTYYNPNWGKTEVDLIRSITFVPVGNGTYSPKLNIDLSCFDPQSLTYDCNGAGAVVDRGSYDDQRIRFTNLDLLDLRFSLNNVGPVLKIGDTYKVKFYLSGDAEGNKELQGYSFPWVQMTVPDFFSDAITEKLLDFKVMTPAVSAQDRQNHQTELGDVEFGVPLVFGFVPESLPAEYVKAGYTIQQKVYVNYDWKGTLVTRTSGGQFDLMQYVDKTGEWQVWFNISLYKNGEYVTSLGHIYNVNVVPAEVRNVSANVTAPVAGELPSDKVSVGGEGYEITDVDWSYFDEKVSNPDFQWCVMPDGMTFEAGREYECALQFETLPGYTFPDNRSDFSGKINGINGSISVNYYKTRAYVTVRFKVSGQAAPAKPYKIANVVSGVHVYWKETAGAVKYGLWRSETGINGTYKWVANPTVPHFTDTKVESGKTYYYKVTAMDASGNHSAQSPAIGVIYVSTPDITSRSNIAAGVKLGWEKITGATGYAIYRKSYSGTDAWVRVGTVSGNSTFTWTDTSVKNNNGTVYKYTIRALAGSDMKTLSGCRNAGRTMARLSSQVLTGATKASSTSIKCQWTTSSRVTGYEVRFMVGDQVYKTFTVGNYKTGVKTFTGLKAGQTYTIQVRTYLKVDGMGFYSDWSEAKIVTL